VARLTGVKLRLGRLTAHGQKGVDSLIVRDLITLAHQRGIASGVVLGGDEDLREGVREAQEWGVRMIIAGIPHAKSRISSTLADEADDVVMLESAFLSAHFQLRPELSPTETPQDPYEVGQRFGKEWVVRAEPDEKALLVQGFPPIPRELDAELLAQGRRFVAKLLTRDRLRVLRNGFRDFVSTAFDKPPGVENSDGSERW
jgi:hypothetical protein